MLLEILYTLLQVLGVALVAYVVIRRAIISAVTKLLQDTAEQVSKLDAQLSSQSTMQASRPGQPW